MVYEVKRFSALVASLGGGYDLKTSKPLTRDSTEDVFAWSEAKEAVLDLLSNDFSGQNAVNQGGRQILVDSIFPAKKLLRLNPAALFIYVSLLTRRESCRRSKKLSSGLPKTFFRIMPRAWPSILPKV